MNFGFFNFSRRHLKELDWPLVVSLLALASLGLVVIDGSLHPSESSALGDEAWPVSRTAVKQLLIALFSIFLFALPILCCEYQIIDKLALPFYWICIVLLVALLLLEQKTKGAASWLVMGNIRFQPSEPMKLAVVLVLARWLARRPNKLERMSDLIVPAMIVGLPVLLIARQPDFGTALVFVPVCFVMLWAAGLRKRHVAAMIVCGLLMAAAVWPQLKPYQQRRIEVFLKPGSDSLSSGYNITQAEIAMGSGRMLGKGWRGGTQTAYEFLPEHHTDFIFSSLAEQFGFVGAMLAIALYAVVIGRALRIASNAKDWQGSFIVIGLITIFITHVVLNIGMCLRLFPVTGLPLPFLSYGGSFLLTNVILFALIINIGMRKYFFE